ncbi:MAG: hypothetical protein PHR35_09100, partial [Kiritimatiellae bacterium]|nr:hypothetical protein [Kiritimatiellia bacterium]
MTYLALMRIIELCDLFKPDIDSFLIDKMQSSDKSVAAAAIVAAGALGGKGEQAIPVLARLAADPANERIRVCAINSLITIGPGAIPTIKELLMSADKSLALSMATAVRGMNRIPEELKNAVDWANPAVAAENGSLLANYSFEADDCAIPGWSVSLEDGAEGTFAIDPSRSRTGLKSVKMTKSNGVGILRLRTAEPVIIDPGSEVLTYRIYFQAVGASPSSLLLLRFEDEHGNLIGDDSGIHGGAGWESQSILRNTPGQFWDRRMIMIKRAEVPRKYFLNVLVYGNPATVWIDDVEFPATPWKGAAAGPTLPQPAVTLAEAMKIIEKRQTVEAKVEAINGHAVLKVNGRAVSPVLYVAPTAPFADFKLMANEGRVDFPVVYVDFMNEAYRYDAARGSYPFGRPLLKKEGQYDFTSAFRVLENALRHCPEAN